MGGIEGGIEGLDALVQSHNCGFPKSLEYNESDIIMIQVYNSGRNEIN
jgi:hypothetical protein